jgi:hypothetical protein
VSCPHSLIGSPDWCSQCRGATVRRVSIVGPEVTIDGEPVERRDRNCEYYARGGRRRRTRQ